MTAAERDEITRCAAMQWAMIILDDQLEDREADKIACIRDLADAE